MRPRIFSFKNAKNKLKEIYIKKEEQCYAKKSDCFVS